MINKFTIPENTYLIIKFTKHVLTKQAYYIKIISPALNQKNWL